MSGKARTAGGEFVGIGGETIVERGLIWQYLRELRWSSDNQYLIAMRRGSASISRRIICVNWAF